MSDPRLHLSEDEIAAYHAGTLSPGEEARAQEHLVDCSECTELLLGLDELTREDGEPAPPQEVKEAWEELRSRLPAAAPVSPLPFPARRPARPVWLQALAAALAAAVVGLGLWNVSLQRERSQPEANAQIVELFPSPLRGGSAPDGPALRPEGRSVTLVLHSDDTRTFAGHEVERVGADGTAIWTVRGLRRQEPGYFSLTLPRRLLEPGTRLRLWGVGDGKREILGEYRLRSAPPGGR